MKFKIITPIFLFCVISSGLFGQSIPNSGFETWEQQTYYEEPAQYSTSNLNTYLAAQTANVTKTTDSYSGNFASKCESISTFGGDISGAMFIGTPGESMINGGVPFNERPDSLNGFAKYNINTLDTASIIVLFKIGGQPIGFCFVQFIGGQTEWDGFSEPITWLFPVVSPDTIAVVIVSSSFFAGPSPGSTIMLDSLHFIGTNLPFPNGDFEDWNEVATEEPNNWFSSNLFTFSSGLSVTKTEDSFEGAFAAKLETKLTMFNDTMAVLTNGQFGDNGPYGGLPVSNTPDKLTGYYKYIPVGPDTALVGLTLFRYDDNTGITSKLEEAFIQLLPANEYTPFEVPVIYDQYPLPDTVNIAISASNITDGVYNGLGSTLYIDAMEISYKPPPTGIMDKLSKDEFKVYPNPATENLNFEFTEAFQNDVNVSILNILGKTVLQETISASRSQSFRLDVSRFESGIYFYRLNTSGLQEFTGKFFIK
jgi:hypothetical protein